MTKDNPLDRPAKPEDRTATDEAGGKPPRGWENIDKVGHDPAHGDDPIERKGTKGH